MSTNTTTAAQVDEVLVETMAEIGFTLNTVNGTLQFTFDEDATENSPAFDTVEELYLWTATLLG